MTKRKGTKQWYARNLIYIYQIRWPPTRHVLLVLTYLFAVYSFVICLVRDQNNKYYKSGNQQPYVEEGQTIQWPKGKAQNNDMHITREKTKYV
jgi:hypothetical protein